MYPSAGAHDGRLVEVVLRLGQLRPAPAATLVFTPSMLHVQGELRLVQVRLGRADGGDIRLDLGVPLVDVLLPRAPHRREIREPRLLRFA